VVVTTVATRHAKLQSNSHCQQTSTQFSYRLDDRKGIWPVKMSHLQSAKFLLWETFRAHGLMLSCLLKIGWLTETNDSSSSETGSGAGISSSATGSSSCSSSKLILMLSLFKLSVAQLLYHFISSVTVFATLSYISSHMAVIWSDDRKGMWPVERPASVITGDISLEIFVETNM